MAHKLRIELLYTEPKIYRTVIVPEHFTFHDLHVVIQCVMNWNDSHLYQFNLGSPYVSDRISLPDSDDEDEDEDDFFFGPRYEKLNALEEKLSTYFNGQKKKINYIYDFGDDWIHSITVNKKPSEEVLIPQCIKGENDAPIDDIGSIPGFYHFLEIIDKKRKSDEDREMLEWCGIPKGKSYHDVYGFDLDEINERLKEAFSVFLKRK